MHFIIKFFLLIYHDDRPTDIMPKLYTLFSTVISIKIHATLKV